MVNMEEIITGIMGAFAPFIGKAIVAIVIVGLIGVAIDIIAHKIRNRKK